MARAASWRDDVLVRDLPFSRTLCHLLPKVELHQHLTGSLPNEVLRDTLRRNDAAAKFVEDVGVIPPSPDGDPKEQLSRNWDLLVRYCEAVAVATKVPADLERLFAAMIEGLARDNVAYCEVRIGLKAQPTKREHLECLAAVIRRQQNRFPGTVVRLLLSLARHRQPSVEAENVELAIEHATTSPHPVVCGVELGGVPGELHWRDFEPLFARARQAGLRVALHCGEDEGRQDEWKAMVAFKPDRLGHGVHLNAANLATVLAQRMPVEACLTCHLCHFGVPMGQNIFGKLWPSQQVVVCTDNPSIYDTTLSREYELLCQHFDVSVAQLFALARRAIDFIFQEETVKEGFRAAFDLRVEAIRRELGILPASSL